MRAQGELAAVEAVETSFEALIQDGYQLPMLEVRNNRARSRRNRLGQNGPNLAYVQVYTGLRIPD